MNNPNFLKLLDRMKVIHDKKSADYTSGPWNENFNRAALISEWFKDPVDKVFATLIGVKLARLASLLGTDKTPQNESIEDSFLDLTTYSALWGSYHADKVNSE